ncbi:MAG: thioredoxin-disulfide reductase [Candidatus Babeliales bacterium]
MVHDVAIIGSGPAGLTAGIYSARAKLNTLVIEGSLPGGQLMNTAAVENWPGMVTVNGPDLMIDMRKQAEACGSVFKSGSVTSVDFSSLPYKLFLDDETVVQTKSVIIATGSINRKLGCPGEAEYFAKGVSVCATCDAPFYKDKDVVIVGGGNSAVAEAYHIAHFARKVTIVHIHDALTANDPLKDKVLVDPKISIIYNATVKEIAGDGMNVTHVMVEDQKTKQVANVSASGVFVAIGFHPNTKFLSNNLEIDQYGYLARKGNTATSKEGVFAAGDVTDYFYRQAITSSGAGCMAALDCQAYLSKSK